MVPENKKYLDKSGLERVGEYINSKISNCIANSISISYNDLSYYRAAGSLKPGQYYRINDYIFKSDITGVTCGTSDAGSHRFDIILYAVNNWELSEKGFAIQYSNSTDDYFYNSKLYLWDIWYCLDNDKNRFGWASSTGKGVIYRMIDEFGNDLPYDFKSAMINGKYTFDINGTDSTMDGTCHDNIINKYIDGTMVQQLNNILFTAVVYDNTFMSNCHDISINANYYRSEWGYGINNITKSVARTGDYILYNRYNSFGKVVQYCEADLINF